MFDLDQLKANGAFICGNDDFVLVRCPNCKHVYLHNKEVLSTYPNPGDLRETFLFVDGVDFNCGGCGLVIEDFEELAGENPSELGGWYRFFI